MRSIVADYRMSTRSPNILEPLQRVYLPKAHRKHALDALIEHMSGYWILSILGALRHIVHIDSVHMKFDQITMALRDSVDLASPAL